MTTPADTLRAAADRARDSATLPPTLRQPLADWLDSAAYDAVTIGPLHDDLVHALAVARALLTEETP